MELAAAEMKPADDQFRQAACLSGLLSLAYVPHSIDVKAFVADLPVGPAIKDAIGKRRGPLGILLSIAEHLEAGRFEEAVEHSRAFGPDFAANLSSLAR